MKKDVLFESKDRLSLNNNILKNLTEWIHFYITTGDSFWTSDLEDMLFPYKLRKADWFRAAELTYNHIISLPDISDNNIQVGMVIVLKPSLVPNTPPLSLLLKDSICQYEGPNFDFMRGSRDAMIKSYTDNGYKKISIKHPFDNNFDVFYGEIYSPDYYDSQRNYYQEIPSYCRYLLFI